MYRIIANQKDRASKWARLAHPTNGHWEWPNYTALLLEKDLEPIAASFYTNFHPGDSIDIHCAAAVGTNWLNRPFLHASFRYPFLDLGVRRLGTLVTATNKRSLQFVRHLGFVEEGRAREAGDDGADIICFGMLKRECRFLDGLAPDIWSIELGLQKLSPGTRSDSDHCGAGFI